MSSSYVAIEQADARAHRERQDAVSARQGIRAPSVAMLMQLQRSAGNQAVNRLLQQHRAALAARGATAPAGSLQRCGDTPCNCSPEEQDEHMHAAAIATDVLDGPDGIDTLQRSPSPVLSAIQRDDAEEDASDQQAGTQTATPQAAADADPTDTPQDTQPPVGSGSDQSNQQSPDPSQFAAQQPTQTHDGDPGQLVSQQSGTSSDSGQTLADQMGSDAEPLSGNGKCGASSTTISVVNKTRTVSGKTLNDVYQNNFSVGEAGSVQPVFDPSPPTYCPTDAGAKIQSAVVNINEVKTMPKWTEYDQQCDAVKKEWDRWYAALDTHENGHIAIDRRFFTNVHAKLVGTTDPDTALNTVVTNADTANQTYDGNPANFAGVNLNAGIGCP